MAKKAVENCILKEGSFCFMEVKMRDLLLSRSDCKVVGNDIRSD